MRLTESKLRKIIREILQTADDYEQRLRRSTGGSRGAAGVRNRTMYDAVMAQIADIVKQVAPLYPAIDEQDLRDAIFQVIEDATQDSI